MLDLLPGAEDIYFTDSHSLDINNKRVGTVGEIPGSGGDLGSGEASLISYFCLSVLIAVNRYLIFIAR
jgi:hypothetical protein